MSTTTSTASGGTRIGAPLLLAVGTFSMPWPFSTDAFLPALPTMAAELHTTGGEIQLTLTGVTLGMALGQLVAGPLSDGVGRRWPLLIGSAAMALAAGGAAFATNLPTLVACCAAVGLGASFGMVVGRAVLADLAHGPVLGRAYALLGTLIGLGPVLSPLFGVAVMALWDWRAVFVGLSALAALALVLLALFVAESLPPARRLRRPFRALPTNALAALRSRPYLRGATVVWFGFIAQFGYIAASAFLIQTVLGLPPLAYAVAFGVNGIGLIGAGLVTARLSSTWSAPGLMALGLAVQSVGAATVLLTTLTGTVSAVTMLPALFLIACSMGLVFGPATGYALRDLRRIAGTALAVLGAVQFVGAGIVSPLVAAGGPHDPVPFALVVSGAVALAWAGWIIFRERMPSASVRAHTREGALDGSS